MLDKIRNDTADKNKNGTLAKIEKTAMMRVLLSSSVYAR